MGSRPAKETRPFVPETLASANELSGGILVLAAGSSRRFGSADKRRANMANGRSLLEATLQPIADSGLPYRVCLAEEDRAHPPLQNQPIHYCENSGLGMGATLASGLGAVPPWDYVLIALGDMPWIGATTFRTIAETATREHIVIPVHAGRRGHPVAFGAAFFSALQNLSGDSGARSVIERRSAHVQELAVDDPNIYRDVDKPADLDC